MHSVMLLGITELFGQEPSWLSCFPVWSLTIGGSYSCLGAISNNPNGVRVIIVNRLQDWCPTAYILVFWYFQSTCLIGVSIQMDGHFLHNLIEGLYMHLYLACNGPDIELVPGNVGHHWMSWDISIHKCVAFYQHPHVFLSHLCDWLRHSSLFK